MSKMITGKIERISVCFQERREVVMLIKEDGVIGPRRLLELSVEPDLPRSNQLRLTEPGDRVEMVVTTSCNGVDGLKEFKNVSLEGEVRYVTKGAA